jgi:sodium/potassium-transporting ATPase subunit alpha
MINNLTREEVFRFLVTSEQGLLHDEAGRRLTDFGANEITGARKISWVKRFAGQFTHFFAILLWIAGGLAFMSEFLHPGEGMFMLGAAIMGVILINGVFTFIQEYRAEKSIEKLRLLLPFHVKVIRDGKENELPVRNIVPGDVIILSDGDRVPADSRLIDTNCLMVNNAPLTGESEPVPLSHKPCEGELIESVNIAFAGTTVLSGSGRAVVFATGMGTEVGRIAHLTSGVEAGLSPLQKEIVKVTRIIAFIATVMGTVIFLIGHAMGKSFWENFIFTIGIIVANVPEGLLPTVTLALAMGSQRMARKKALIKTMTSVETLGSVTHICTDKTGTLTQNRMEVKKVWTIKSQQLAVSGQQAGDRGGVSPPLQHNDVIMLMKVAYLCNNTKIVEGKSKGEPTEVALFNAAEPLFKDLSNERVFELPFDSDRKRMTTVCQEGVGGQGPGFSGKDRPPMPGPPSLVSYTKGALESVLPLCSSVLTDGKVVPLDGPLREEVTAACNSLMDQGLRVLSFAYKERGVLQYAPADSNLEADLIFAGLIGIEDPPRPEVSGAIMKCHEAGIRVIMITGDGNRTAVAIAREIGLVHEAPLVIGGHEFAGMSDRELKEKLLHKEVIFARMAPKHKMRVVTLLKEEGARVAVTGDGVNDAPALKKADIGIAMGIAGTDVAKEAADMILLDDNFATIVNAIEEGRAVYENIRKFISYIFSSNIPEIVPYLAYVLFSIPLPLTIMQILAVDLGTDMLPALALGAERPSKDLMKQPPRDPRERLLNAKLLARAYLFLGPVEAAAGLFGFFYVLMSGGWQRGDMPALNDPLYLQATTACLTAIIVTQVANVFACRSFRESVFAIGIFSNKLIFPGIVLEILLQLFIVYHPWGNRIFSTGPLSAGIWLVLVPFAVFLLSAEEARKFISRSIARRG